LHVCALRNAEAQVAAHNPACISLPHRFESGAFIFLLCTFNWTDVLRVIGGAIQELDGYCASHRSMIRNIRFSIMNRPWANETAPLQRMLCTKVQFL